MLGQKFPMLHWLQSGMRQGRRRIGQKASIIDARHGSLRCLSAAGNQALLDPLGALMATRVSLLTPCRVQAANARPPDAEARARVAAMHRAGSQCGSYYSLFTRAEAFKTGFRAGRRAIRLITTGSDGWAPRRIPDAGRDERCRLDRPGTIGRRPICAVGQSPRHRQTVVKSMIRSRQEYQLMSARTGRTTAWRSRTSLMFGKLRMPRRVLLDRRCERATSRRRPHQAPARSLSAGAFPMPPADPLPPIDAIAQPFRRYGVGLR